MTARLLATATCAATLCLAGAARAQTCATDSDCASGMVCHAQTSTMCTGQATAPCAPNTKCEPPTPPVCTETTTYSCRYRWELPCNTAADCGDGFVCQPITQGTCSSSGSTGGGTISSGGSSSGVGGGTGTLAPPDAIDAGAPACVTTTSFPGRCQPKIIPCTSDSDCPVASGLTCKDSPFLPVRDGQPIAIVVDGGSAPQPADMPTATDTSTGTSVKLCQPPYGSSTPISTGGRGEPGPNLSIDAGASGTTTKGGSTPPVVTPGSDTSTNTQTTTQPVAKTGGGGCAVAGSGSASAAWMALLGLLALAFRRRR